MNVVTFKVFSDRGLITSSQPLVTTEIRFTGSRLMLFPYSSEYLQSDSKLGSSTETSSKVTQSEIVPNPQLLRFFRKIALPKVLFSKGHCHDAKSACIAEL